MFLLKFKDTSSGVVNQFLADILKFDMVQDCHTLYVKSRDFDERFTNHKVNGIIVDLEEATEEDFDVDDLMLSVLDSEVCPIIKLPKDEDTLEVFTECVNIYKVPYLNYERIALNMEPTLDNSIDYFVMDEIFNDVRALSKVYSPARFNVSVDITEDTVTVNGNCVPLHQFDLRDLYNYIDVTQLKAIGSADYFTSKYLISPLPFYLIPQDEVVERLNAYKIKVFEKTMKLTARDMTKLPVEVANMLVRAGYVPLEDLLKYESELKELLA